MYAYIIVMLKEKVNARHTFVVVVILQGGFCYMLKSWYCVECSSESIQLYVHRNKFGNLN